MMEKIKAWLIINAGVPDFVAFKITRMTISEELKINTFVYTVTSTYFQEWQNSKVAQ